jgi:drug/metabolite transporter (DMT)-like permease
VSDATERRRAAIVMAILALVWGYAWVIAKIGLSLAGPFTFAALRTVCGVIALGAFLLIKQGHLSRRPPPGAILVGLIQTGAFLMLNTWALSGGEPGKTSILTFTMPFWVLLFAWPALSERVAGLQWIAIVFAVAGLVLIMEPWLMHAGILPKVLAVMAGMAWAIGVVLTKRLQRHAPVDAFDFTFWQMVFGLAPMVVVALIVPEPIPPFSTLLAVTVVLSGVLATAGGWLMWQYVLNRLPAGTTSLASLAVPVVATISSAIQLGERLRAAELFGAALIAVALALVSLQAVRSHTRDDPSMAQE